MPSVLTDQPLVGIEEVGGLCADLLADPPPEGVVFVRGGAPVGELHARQSVGGAVIVGGGHAALALGHRVAVCVVGENGAVVGEKLVVPVVAPGPFGLCAGLPVTCAQA